MFVEMESHTFIFKVKKKRIVYVLELIWILAKGLIGYQKRVFR